MAQMIKNRPFGAFEGLEKKQNKTKHDNHVAPSGGQERNNLEVSLRHQQWSGVVN